MKPTIAALLFVLTSLGTQAQTVWRCEVAGRTVYSDTGCVDGHALHNLDARTPEQVRAAQRVAFAEAQLAQRLVQLRQSQEREIAAQGPGLIAIGSTEPERIKRWTNLARR